MENINDVRLKEILNLVDNNNNIKNNIEELFSSDGYKSKPLVSANLSRLLNHIKSGNSFCFITAFVYQSNEEDINSIKYKEKKNKIYNFNIKRNLDLATDVRILGFGFIQLEGVWRGIDKDNNSYEDIENSFFVVGNNINYNEFKRDMIKLQLKYNQESIIVGGFIVDNFIIERTNKNGKVIENFNNISIPSDEKLLEIFEKNKNEGTGYTRLKNKKFIFSGIYSYRPMSMYSVGSSYNDRYYSVTGVKPIPWR